MRTRGSGRIGRIVPVTLGGVLLCLAIAVCQGTEYVTDEYEFTFDSLLYTIASPLRGTGGNLVWEGVARCLPPVLVGVAAIVVVALALCQRRVSVSLLRRGGVRLDILKVLRRLFPVVGIVVLLLAVRHLDRALGVSAWLIDGDDQTTIYEEHYVDPSTVSIGTVGRPKNLIHIYLESMEVTYATSQDDSGTFNCIPNLTSLALDANNVSFSNTEGLGGFYSTTGTGWTMGALFSSTTGLPFAFPVGRNAMSERETFATGVTALGDILEDQGYVQEFLCGSDGLFGGRSTYFEQHGGYEVFDYDTAIERGYIDKDYKVWWGFEDSILYDIAKDEVLRLAEGDEPFNLTFLTVDQHATGGYVCSECGSDYDTPLANVLACGDHLVADFISWCRQQDFYDDTVIVITGDHPRMDKILVGERTFDERRVYDCFLNAQVAPELPTTNRTFTTQDLFPTTLAAMGFTIEGDRLGLGTNLFSSRPTLAEELGLATLDEEFAKRSTFYLTHFS